jgi:hypothetical protein
MQELRKGDTETRSEHMLLENGADTLARRRVVTNLQVVKEKKKAQNVRSAM